MTVMLWLGAAGFRNRSKDRMARGLQFSAWSSCFAAWGLQERPAGVLEFLFQPRSAIATAACPGFCSVLVAALAAVVRVLHAMEMEVFFPVGAFFLEWRRTIADLNPPDRVILAKTGVLHVAQIFAFRYRPVPKSFVFYGFQQVAFAPWFHAGSDEVSHKNSTQKACPRMAPI